MMLLCIFMHREPSGARLMPHPRRRFLYMSRCLVDRSIISARDLLFRTRGTGKLTATFQFVADASLARLFPSFPLRRRSGIVDSSKMPLIDIFAIELFVAHMTLKCLLRAGMGCYISIWLSAGSHSPTWNVEVDDDEDVRYVTALHHICDMNTVVCFGNNSAVLFINSCFCAFGGHIEHTDAVASAPLGLP